MMCVPRCPQDVPGCPKMSQEVPGCRAHGHTGAGRNRQGRQDSEGTRRYQSANAAREKPCTSKILRLDMHMYMGGLRSCTCAVARFLASQRLRRGVERHRDYPLFYERRWHRVRQTPWFPVNPCHVFSVFGPDPFAGARLAAHGSGRPICQVGPDARRLFAAPPRVALRVFTVADLSLIHI